MRRSARYALAIFSVGLVVCLKLLFWPHLVHGAPFVMFFGAVLLTANYAGRAPAVVAALLSAVAANYYFMSPTHTWDLSLPNLIQTSLFVLEALVISEVSARWRESEGEARRQRDLLHTTLLSIGDAVVATDRSGRVTLMNPVAESLLEVGQEEAEGRPVEEVFRIVSESTHEGLDSPVRQVLAKGVAVTLGDPTMLVSRSGAEIPIDDSGAPIRGADGLLAGAVLVFRDVTERRLAARALEDSARRYANVLENIKDGFAILD